MPTNVKYVENSILLCNSNHKEGCRLKDNNLTTSGINIGDYDSRGNAYVQFTGMVTDNSLAIGSNQLVTWASATVRFIDGVYVYKDDASVLLNK